MKNKIVMTETLRPWSELSESRPNSKKRTHGKRFLGHKDREDLEVDNKLLIT
jgi:hypothetical protein